MKVLVVEDDVLIRMFIKKRLMQNGCDAVFEASRSDQSVFNEEEINSLFDYHLSKPVNPDEFNALFEKITTRLEGNNCGCK